MTAAARFLPRADLDRLFTALTADGRRVVGPTVVDGSIVHDELSSFAELPKGWTAETAPGSYRLQPTGRDRLFDYNVGATSWKRFTHPSIVPLTRGRRDGGQVVVEAVEVDPPRLAFVGARACEIAALRIQDRAMRAGPLGDADHIARGDAALVVAVECAVAASTCFCTSMGTGPEIDGGADIILSELDEGFVVRTGTAAGAAVVDRLELGPAESLQSDRAHEQVAAVRAAIGDPVPGRGPGDPAASRPRPSALGRGRGTLPGLRQLHAGLPHLLLHERCGRLGPRRGRGHDGAHLGQLLQPGLRPRRGRRQLPAQGQGPLPAVAHPQVLDLVGPVRFDRLRRVRPLHRLVPGGHRRP